MVIFQVISHLIERVDNEEKVAGLFLDLSKAFDTILYIPADARVMPEESPETE